MQLGYLYPLRYKEDGPDSLGIQCLPRDFCRFLGWGWGLALSIYNAVTAMALSSCFTDLSGPQVVAPFYTPSTAAILPVLIQGAPFHTKLALTRLQSRRGTGWDFFAKSSKKLHGQCKIVLL